MLMVPPLHIPEVEFRIASLSVWKQPQNRLGSIRTQNRRAFHYDPKTLYDMSELVVNDQPLEISKYASDTVVVVSDDSGEWIVSFHHVGVLNRIYLHEFLVTNSSIVKP